MNANKRDIWVDNVKVIACILVVLGHFFQSMVKSNLMVGTFAYNYFEDTIYYFHVPLFFICSGYLYQKYSSVNKFETWINSVIKKIIALGIPYFVFTFITWVLKKVFASSVNGEIGGILDTFFVHPTSPYWYLYILFIFFVITVTTKTKRMQLIMFGLAIVVRGLSELGFATGLYFIDKSMENWVWFVLGMLISYNVMFLPDIKLGIVLFVVFLTGSYVAEIGYIPFPFVSFALTLLACCSIIGIMKTIFEDGMQKKNWSFGTRYTMPIFLMHTLFAAPLRSVLLKVGITNLVAHVALGLVISFAGPIIAMLIMERIKPLDFVVYPNRYLKYKGRK